MTELEKLADVYVRPGGYAEEYGRQEALDAYMAGFRKAREMACSALYDSGSDPTGYGENAIKQLGEREVE